MCDMRAVANLLVLHLPGLKISKNVVHKYQTVQYGTRKTLK